MRRPLSLAGIKVANFSRLLCLVYIENPANDEAAAAVATTTFQRCLFSCC
jgi:hypothetical protein